jgi:Arc/MetJ family transcription regulator
MPTNLAIDDKLIDEARRIGKHKTKKEAVTAALVVSPGASKPATNGRFKAGHS